MILVTGASGRVGSQVARVLLEKSKSTSSDGPGYVVRMAGRDPEALRNLHKQHLGGDGEGGHWRAQFVKFDYGDTATWEAALEGYACVYLCTR